MMVYDNIDNFLAYYSRIRQRTERVVACIPPENMDWTYREGKFSFADLVRHIAAIERYMYAENVHGRPSRYPGHREARAMTFSGPLEYMRALHTESLALFRLLGPADMQRKVETPAGTPITVWKWLRAMVEHEIHHRAQLYTYLGILGIDAPPIFGLSAEEVQALSGTRTGSDATA